MDLDLISSHVPSASGNVSLDLDVSLSCPYSLHRHWTESSIFLFLALLLSYSSISPAHCDIFRLGCGEAVSHASLNLLGKARYPLLPALNE